MTDVALARRKLLRAGVAAVLPSGLGGEAAYLSAATVPDRAGGQHLVVGFERSGKEAFRIPLPARAHQIAVAPNRETAFVAPRRPGNRATAVDLIAGTVRAFCDSAEGRHFYGHAVYSADGQYLLATENDYRRGRGVVSVRRAATLRVVAEFESGGIGPHQLAWMPDKKTLVVANGGILTHPDRPRKKLNLATMRPNLALIDAASGQLLHRASSTHHKASIRHIAVADDGLVVAGMQYEGPPADDVPLLAALPPSSQAPWPEHLAPLTIALSAQRSLKQYIGSVAVDATTKRLVATCPRANLVTFWDIAAGRCLAQQRFRDCCGVALDAPARQFIVSNGSGRVLRFDSATFERQDQMAHLRDLQWDNHLTAVQRPARCASGKHRQSVGM